MSDLCLTLLCPPAVEEKLLDMLLSSSASVFTSTATAAHGLAFGNLSQTEQVMGRAQATEIRVVLPASQHAGLLEDIRRHFAGTGLRYWVMPVAEAGEIA